MPGDGHPLMIQVSVVVSLNATRVTSVKRYYLPLFGFLFSTGIALTGIYTTAVRSSPKRILPLAPAGNTAANTGKDHQPEIIREKKTTT